MSLCWNTIPIYHRAQLIYCPHMVQIRITEQIVWQASLNLHCFSWETTCRGWMICILVWQITCVWHAQTSGLSELPLKAAGPTLNVLARKCNLGQFLNITDPLPAWSLPLKIPVNLNLCWNKRVSEWVYIPHVCDCTMCILVCLGLLIFKHQKHKEKKKEKICFNPHKCIYIYYIFMSGLFWTTLYFPLKKYIYSL